MDDFKNNFIRDFSYGEDSEENVLDSDILRALKQSVLKINKSLFSTQDAYTESFLNLTAHNMIINLRSSHAGICGEFDLFETSQSLDSLSNSKQWPEWMMENPNYAILTKTTYGILYLDSIVNKTISIRVH